MKIIKTDTLIQTPAIVVWDILANFDQYNRWNPIFQNVRGLPDLGTKLCMDVELPDKKPRTMCPVVMEYKPPQLIIWESRLLFPGIFNASYHMIINSESSKSCKYTQEYKFSGFLLPFKNHVIDKNKRALDELGFALKVYAEKFTYKDPPGINLNPGNGFFK